MALTRGERFDYIKQIAGFLDGEKLPQIALALDTFGASDINRWECDDDNEYVISRLRSTEDGVIV
jgi:hypothetical protein